LLIPLRSQGHNIFPASCVERKHNGTNQPPPASCAAESVASAHKGTAHDNFGVFVGECHGIERREQGLDTILREPSPLFPLIKEHYPHFCHLQGKNGEPCFYEQPPKTNLKALRAGGVNLNSLLRHYKMITEYQWQWCERDDLQHSIYIIDLEGIRMMDFVGESVEFVKLASAFSAQHYPERAGFVFVVNVPSWFKMIWTVVKPIVDEDTLHKIYILRGKDEIRKAMMERIPLENIPPMYGGTSVPLGESPEERTLAEWIGHNNALAAEKRTCCDDEECKFCNWTPARAY